MKNAFTVDLEDWFCSHNLRGTIRPEDWASCDLRIVESTHRLLGLLSRFDVEATFFVLGWIAERLPRLVQEIEECGHEIGSHSYSHTPVTEMTPASFGDDLELALDVTKEIVDAPIIGFRAPAFTVTPRTLWVLDMLGDHGFVYDSSVYPLTCHPDYGMSDAPLSPYRHGKCLIEVPLSCVDFAGLHIPCSGGCYFRLFPYPVFRMLAKACNRAGRPIIFYIHPWEIDPDQPRLSLRPTQRLRHYTNLDKTFGRLRRLLMDFEFTSIGSLLNHGGIVCS